MKKCVSPAGQQGPPQAGDDAQMQPAGLQQAQQPAVEKTGHVNV
jgi:hypothetical protein